MAYLVIAYPVLAPDDFAKIQNFRKQNDELYFKVINPHFTLVFPVFDISEDEFVREISNQSKSLTRFGFTIRCATINKDAFSDYFHTFLVPDEGHSQIIKLHDKLYCDKLKDHLRPDIDFIPHIGVGNSKDNILCKKMVDKWNKEEFAISGSITHLTIVKYEPETVTTVEEIELK